MHPQIHIRNLNINLRARSLAALTSERARQPEPTSTIILPAPVGTELQGGIYTGPMVEDGKLIHLIRAKESLGDTNWDAAKDKASEYRGGGLDDWYLPPKREMIVGLVHDQEGFDQVWHWAATPYGQDYAWAVDFENGNVSSSSRSYEFRVRPFRRFIP